MTLRAVEGSAFDRDEPNGASRDPASGARLASTRASAAELTRRRLTPKQAGLIERLIAAAGDEAREQGYEGMTVRSAARRAGVAPATAYSYFASKDHLLAEVLWHQMESLPEVVHDPNSGPLERVASELQVLGLFMSDDTKLAAACTTALLGAGPEVRSLRVRFGAAVNDRLSTALGDAADPAVLEGLDLAYSGAMLWGGMGHMPFSAVPHALFDVAKLLLEGAR